MNGGEKIWNMVYTSDNTFFGDKPSIFAMFCFNYVKSKYNMKKMLDLGAGHGRDSIFFALNGFEEVCSRLLCCCG